MLYLLFSYGLELFFIFGVMAIYRYRYKPSVPRHLHGKVHGKRLRHARKQAKLDARGVQVQLRPAQVLIFGHSFVKNLNRFLRENHGDYHNLGFDYSRAHVHWLGIGGMRVDQARGEQLIAVERVRPDIVYVELGTVDMTNPKLGPEEIGSEIHELALDMIALGVKKVIVGEIIHREGKGIPRRMLYVNQRVNIANLYLSAVLGPQFTPKARFWRHKRFWHSAYPLLKKDGVHPNTLGSRRLFRSIRGAVLQAIFSLPELF